MLNSLQHKETLGGRLIRWAEYLIKFDFDIIYWLGKDSQVLEIFTERF